MSLHYVQGMPYFTGIREPKRQYPYLTKDQDTEVIIIGGGLTGCILGYYFASTGIPSVILEKRRIAYGSTSIATALLQYELDSLTSELMPYTTVENVLLSFELGKKALAQLDSFIEKYGNHCNYSKRDSVLYTAKKEDASVLMAEYEVKKKAGYNVKFLTRETNPFLFDLEGGIYSSNENAEVDPYLYAEQLLDVGLSNGLKVFENTPVLEITYQEDGVTAETEYGYKVKGKIAIIATGYDTDCFSKRQFGTKDLSYNIVTNPLESLDGWHHHALIRDYNDPYNYYRTTMDNRIIAGGQDVPFEENINKEEAAEKAYDTVLQNIKRIYPMCSDIRMEYKYCGAFASTQDNLGFIGPDPKHEKLWYCLGYGANGILFSLLGGDMLSRLYKGDKDKNMDLFRIDRFDGSQ